MTGSISQTYLLYRNLGKVLNQKIMDTSLSADVLQKAASLLGIQRGNTLIFREEDETSVLMDFALHDILVDGKRNTIQLYKDTVGWKDELEHKLLDALLSSRTSLFKVFAISHDEYTLYLKDVLQNRDYELPSYEPTMRDLVGTNLVDVNLSQTALPGVLLFTRVVPFEEFSMTGGAGFVFDGQLQRFLSKRCKVLERKIRYEHEPARRYVAFYKLNEQHGLRMRLA